MSRFIITGATGFVGSNLCRKLIKENHEVSIICRENSKLDNLKDVIENINIFRYDNNVSSLTNYFNEVKPHCVIHLASLILIEHNENSIKELIDSNISFGCEILEAMRLTNVKNFINTSTSWQHYNNEDYNPVSFYAATKEAFEKILEFYVNAYDFKAISLVLFDTYGENDKRNKLINNLKDISKNNRELKVSKGYQKIDLNHIDDVVYGYLCAFKNLSQVDYKGHNSYAISSRRHITLRELIALFEKENDCKLDVDFGGRPYRFREVMEPWCNYKLLPNFESKISLEEGLRRVYNFKQL